MSAAEPPARPLPDALARARVVLVHDWLTGMRGGEKVLEAIAALFPGAPIHTLVHVPGSVSAALERHPIRTAFTNRLPASGRAYRHYLPLFPMAVEAFDLDGFDLVISTSHCAAKSALRTGRARHLCYCHSPMRYAWDQFDSYFGPGRIGGLSRVLRVAMRRLAAWDAATSGRPDRYLANSQYVARRIARYYNRRSTVVFPPVDTRFYCPGPPVERRGCLVVSALVPYKRVDVAVEACRQAGEPLTVVGTGPELARLRQAAGAAVEFLGWRSDEDVRALYRGARAVLLPGEEDFGIVPVEAMACGTPVIALAAGGARETVADGVTGRLVPVPDPAAFAEAIRTLPPPDEAAVRAHAERFSHDRFAATFVAAAAEVLAAEGHDPRW